MAEEPTSTVRARRRPMLGSLDYAVLLLGLAAMLTMPPMIRATRLSTEQEIVRNFAASGTVQEFVRAGDAWRLRVDYRTLESGVIRLDESLLAPGVSFEKSAGSKDCLINGTRYPMY